MTKLVRPVGRLLAPAAALLAACKGTEPPHPTTVVITPAGAVSFTAVGDTARLRAQVRDQHGDSMPGVRVTWSTDKPLVATVNDSGVVTAAGNGTAQVTASAGTNASGSVVVSVAQAAAQVSIQSGDQQAGTVGQALSTALVVRVNDRRGNPIPSAPVTWVVAAGGGSVSGSNADANGLASAMWTLGTTAGSAAATATSGSATATFSATQIAGPASAIAIAAGNNQSATVNTAVQIAPRVRVTDQFGNSKSSITVNWAVTAGGGSVSPASSLTNTNGEATVTSWTMGSSGGVSADTLGATIAGVGASVKFVATATVAGPAATVAMFVGDGQTALAGYAVNTRPAVRVADNTSQPVAGVQVTFAVASGGGSATGTAATTNAYGIAQVGSWQVQLGTNTLTATASASGLTGNPVTFTATGASPTFNIELQNFGPTVLPVVQAAFDSARAKWQRIIYQDVADIANFSSGAGQCGPGSPAIGPRTVDDLLIIFKVDSIDGPGGVLGFAGPCWIRSSGFLPIMGTMVFDSADIQTLVSGGHMNEVILHEMGHILGFGTLWDPTFFGCLQNPSSTGNPQDTYYSCARARVAFDSIGGLNYTGGNKVPVENCGTGAPSNCGSGTYNSHWRESVFGTELMTGFINSGVNPLSILSVASMEDMGYVVNYSAADPYSRTFSLRAALTVGGTVSGMGDDIYRGPIYVADAAGRTVGVIPAR